MNKRRLFCPLGDNFPASLLISAFSDKRMLEVELWRVCLGLQRSEHLTVELPGEHFKRAEPQLL